MLKEGEYIVAGGEAYNQNFLGKFVERASLKNTH
jgi:hypothetical protein